jgi:hypothetical protein
MDHAARACDLTDWIDWHPLAALAAACAETDQFEKAIRIAEQAIDYAPKAEKSLRLERLELYKSHKK